MQLVIIPDDRLFQNSTPLLNVDSRIFDIANSMIETMHRAKGVGLAGVQVGVTEQIFVVHVDDDVPRIFINPKIKNQADKLVSYEEGCLSIPGLYAYIDRPESIFIEAIDGNGNPFEMEADGFLARVIQHEYDHLIGRLFYQHLSERKQTRFLQSYAKLHNMVL